MQQAARLTPTRYRGAMAVAGEPSPERARLAELRDSARGWHGVQLGVLAFIGLCGVLTQERSSTPGWLEALAGLLALSALATACLATFLVGRAAWPLYGRGNEVTGTAEDVARTSQRLRTGLGLTFLSVALTALAASASWWPSEGEGASDLVAVQAASGQSWCGPLGEAQAGALSVLSGGQRVEVALDSLAAVRPVDSCE